MRGRTARRGPPVLVITALCVALATGSGCSENCDAIRYNGTVHVDVIGQPSSDASSLRLCVDDQCWTGSVSEVTTRGVLALHPPADGVTPRATAGVTFDIGNDRPRAVRSTMTTGANDVCSEITLQPARQDHGSCHRPTYSARVQLDARTGLLS